MTTAIFGGSFNMPHQGHVFMALRISAHPEVTRIRVVPCYKQAGKELADFEHRVRMCELAFIPRVPHVIVDRIEETLGENAYTYKMIEALKAAYPEESFILFLGEDLRDKMSTWEHPEKIDIPIRFLPRTNISSSAIRERLQSGDPSRITLAKGFLPKPVADYIDAHEELYQCQK